MTRTDDNRHTTLVRLPHAAWMRLNSIKAEYAAGGRFVAVNTIICEMIEDALDRHDQAFRDARKNGRKPVIIMPHETD
jgi:hypothetical protein